MKIRYCRRCESDIALKGRKFCLKCINFLAREKAKKTREILKFRIVLKKLKKKEKKENSLSRLTKIADTLFAKAIKKRDGKCLRTGSTENLQCSHIFSRRNKSVRWDMLNAITLSAGQHLYWWHREPAEAIIWVKKLLGEENWTELERRKDAYFKNSPSFMKQKIQELKELLK